MRSLGCGICCGSCVRWAAKFAVVCAFVRSLGCGTYCGLSVRWAAEFAVVRTFIGLRNLLWFVRWAAEFHYHLDEELLCVLVVCLSCYIIGHV